MNARGIDEFLQETENQSCVDCLGKPTRFVLVWYGTFVCEACREAHLEMGGESSRVKGVDEGWDNDELVYVRVGGNSRFWMFLEGYGIPISSRLLYKYNTIAVEFYKKQLISHAESTPIEQSTPSIEEGIQSPYENIEKSEEPVKLPDTSENIKNPEKCFSIVSDSFETGKKALERFAESENVKFIQTKTKKLLQDIQEGVKTTTDSSKANLDKCIEYGREGIEWSKTSCKEKILNSVEVGKDTIFKTVEKGKEKIKAGVDYSIETVAHGVDTGKKKLRKSIEAGTERVKAGVEYSKESIEHGIEAGKTKIKKSIQAGKDKVKAGVDYSKETIEHGIEAGKTKIKHGIEYGKETIIEGKEKIYEKVENGKNTIFDGIDKSKEFISGGVEKVTNIIVETAESGKMKVESGVSGVKEKIYTSVKDSKDTLVHYFSPEKPEESKEHPDSQESIESKEFSESIELKEIKPPS